MRTARVNTIAEVEAALETYDTIQDTTDAAEWLDTIDGALARHGLEVEVLDAVGVTDAVIFKIVKLEAA